MSAGRPGSGFSGTSARKNPEKPGSGRRARARARVISLGYPLGFPGVPALKRLKTRPIPALFRAYPQPASLYLMRFISLFSDQWFAPACTFFVDLLSCTHPMYLSNHKPHHNVREIISLNRERLQLSSHVVYALKIISYSCEKGDLLLGDIYP